MSDRQTRMIASVGLAVGGVLGMAGSFVPSASWRGLCWGLDGTALVVAAALLAVFFFRKGQDGTAAGFVVFAIGEGVIMSISALPLDASGPAFGAGAALWAAALVMISATRAFPVVVRVVGVLAAVLIAVTAVEIFWGAAVNPLTSPLPFNAYPVLVATMAGWIWTLLREKSAAVPAAQTAEAARV